MIGDIDWFGQIVGAVPEGDISWNKQVAKALIRQGLAVVIIEPNGKKAVCTLTARDAKKADQEAQARAKEAGSPNWDKVRHDCGIKHAITDEKALNRTRIKAHLENGANIAVAPGAGSKRIIIVDVDTAEEKRAFLEDWGSDEPLTVSSPGTMNANVNGEKVWVHKEGGHYWFDIPEGVELPERPGKLTWCRCHGSSQPQGGCRNAWAAYYGSGYVLVPPSVRPEGSYRLTGSVHSAPEWLSGLIRDARTSERSERADGALSALDLDDDPIDRWSAQHSWREILTEDGFSPHDHDACGCPTFTRPGDATHSKSVTGHELGCAKYDTSKGHGPLRIWSDALGTGTMSKLSYVAKFRHDGDIGAAMRELGIESMTGSDDLWDMGEIDPKGSAVPDSSSNGTAPGSVDHDAFAPINWGDAFATDFEKTDHLPGQLLERGQQIALIGDGKSGKSLFMGEWCFKAIQGHAFLTENTTEPLTIMYIDGENSLKDLVMRFRAYGATPEILQRLVYLSFPPFKPLDSNDGAKQVMALVNQHNPDVVILDTVSRFIQGKENDSDTWLNLYRVLHRRLKGRNIAGIRLDHFGKDAEKGGRGSSAKTQDVDHVWELKVKESDERTKGTSLEVTTLLTLSRTHSRTGLGTGFLHIKRTGLRTEDEWLPGETRHEIADAFDGGMADLDDEGNQIPTPAMERRMRRVCEVLTGMDNGMPLRQIRDMIGGRGKDVDDALNALIERGFVSREKIGRANVHTLLKPYAPEPEDG